jgi:hypothetical protein
MSFHYADTHETALFNSFEKMLNKMDHSVFRDNTDAFDRVAHDWHPQHHGKPMSALMGALIVLAILLGLICLGLLLYLCCRHRSHRPHRKHHQHRQHEIIPINPSQVEAVQQHNPIHALPAQRGTPAQTVRAVKNQPLPQQEVVEFVEKPMSA